MIGLSAKNAILIIEFAKDLHAAGQGPRSRRRCEAVHLRFRPILMTSLAFILGVLPLVVRQRRRLGQPARHRHRRDGRHDHRDRARGLLRAGVLRRRAPLLQGQRRAQRRTVAPMHGRRAPATLGGRERSCAARRCRSRRALAVLAARCAGCMHDPEVRAAGGAGAGDLSARDRAARPRRGAGRGRDRLAALLRRPAPAAA